MQKELGRGTRKLFCEEFPVALHLYCRRSRKREFIWASSEWSLKTWAEVSSASVCCSEFDTVSVSFARKAYLDSFGLMQSRLGKKSTYTTGRILLLSPPLRTCSLSLEDQS